MNEISSLNLIGNKIAESLLQKIANQHRNQPGAATYILNGYDEHLKLKAVLWLAKSLSCVDERQWQCGVCRSCKQSDFSLSPDYHRVTVAEDKKGIGIEQIKQLISQLSLSSFSKSNRFVVIEKAETMSDSAGNALLKTLEEPGARIVIVLLVDDVSHIPQTIASRSQIINIKQSSNDLVYDYLIESYQANRGTAKTIANLSLGQVGQAELYINNEELLSERLKIAQEFLKAICNDVNVRLDYLQKLLSSTKGKGDYFKPSDIISAWQGVLRDLMLYQYGEFDLVQHTNFLKDFEASKHIFSTKRITNGINILTQTKTYLQANVNTQLALEQAIINI